MTLSEARRAAIEAEAREAAGERGRRYQHYADRENYRLGYIAGATAEAERAEALVEALAAMYDQAGCDCDSAYLKEDWEAPFHAPDCPVFVRWKWYQRRVPRALAPYREAEAPRIGTLDTFFDAVERRRGEAEA